MPVEIERKFLVCGDFTPFVTYSERIVQGYLSDDPERTVRIRIKGEHAYITIKGKGNKTGISRFEWEKEISISDAQQLLKLCLPGIIDKVRHIVPVTGNDKLKFEIDVFGGENEGLIMAEIEMESENDLFDKPNWLGKEVTGDVRYYNANLIKNPYTRW